jgi:hypothetical protein
MFRLIVALLVLFFVCGCARVQTVSDMRQASSGVDMPLLAGIRIERWGEQRFSGILVVSNKDRGLLFALLDGTGVTLLEGEVPFGAGEKTQVSGVLRDLDLADYLATAFSRIFLLDPEEKPCSKGFWQSLCLDYEGGKRVRKTRKIGPFTAWSAQYADTGGKTKIIYKEPWVGVQITIKEKSM